MVEYIQSHVFKDFSLVVRFCDFDRCVIGLAKENVNFEWSQCRKYYLIRHKRRPTVDHYTVQALSYHYEAGDVSKICEQCATQVPAAGLPFAKLCESCGKDNDNCFVTRRNDMNFLINVTDVMKITSACIIKTDKPQLQVLSLMS